MGVLVAVGLECGTGLESAGGRVSGRVRVVAPLFSQWFKSGSSGCGGA